MALLTLVAVLYLGIVAALGLATALGAPLLPAVRSGFVVARLGSVVVAALDGVTLLRGHRPADVATHVAYVVCAVVLPWLLTSRAILQTEAAPAPWVVSFASVATAVVLVRMAQTWG